LFGLHGGEALVYSPVVLRSGINVMLELGDTSTVCRR